MRSFVVAIVFLAVPAGIIGDPPSEPVADRVARLIEQLGHDQFAKREAASKELDAIGEPALDALRKAAASDRDPEIRSRAGRIVEALAARARRRELGKWAGSWKSPEGVWLKITGDRWSSGTPTFGPTAGSVWVTEIKEKVVLADFAVEEGPTKGQTCKAIFRLEGDSLHYCATYAGHYPTEFKTVGNYFACVLKRVKE
jgi:uncharacterized protein (TIGR03067 family)